jgi:hypothetical protein
MAGDHHPGGWQDRALDSRPRRLAMHIRRVACRGRPDLDATVAKALGLTIPQSVLLRVDEKIQ